MELAGTLRGFAQKDSDGTRGRPPEGSDTDLKDRSNLYDAYKLAMQSRIPAKKFKRDKAKQMSEKKGREYTFAEIGLLIDAERKLRARRDKRAKKQSRTK